MKTYQNSKYSGKPILCINCKKYDESAECCSMGIIINTSRCNYEPIK